MMNTCKRIKTVIIDDDQDAIFSLEEHLSFFPEIELVGSTDKYPKAKKLLVDSKPDLAFLDIEMPCKNGFELLHEVRESGCDNLSVIFYTAYNQYVIQALRESALDYILKPVDPNELKKAIRRYIDNHRKTQSNILTPLYQGMPGIPEIVALPTCTGIKLVDKNSIVIFRFLKKTPDEKPVWIVMLHDFSHCRLRTDVTAKKIIQTLGTERFIIINQSAIVNLSYLAAVEFKTRICSLIPPYNQIQLIASRTQISEIRDQFNWL